MQAESYVLTKHSPFLSPGITFAEVNQRGTALRPSLERMAELLGVRQNTSWGQSGDEGTQRGGHHAEPSATSHFSVRRAR